MAAANESQGLKIAVAAFVSLTVILAVTSYFLYSNYSQTYARMEAADKKAGDAVKEAVAAKNNLDEMRNLAGYPRVEDFDTLKTTIKKDNEKLLNDMNSVVAETKKLIAAYQESGGSDAKIKELEQASERLVAGYADEPNKTFASSLARLRDLLSTQAYLTTEYAVDNLNLRESLKSANAVNQAKLDTQIEAVTKTKTDLDSEHSDHEKARQDLLAKVDKLQTDFQNLSTEFENLKTKDAQMRDDYEKKLSDFRTQLTYYKDLFEQKDTVMDSPDGIITDIDYTHGVVHTSITRGMGVRPQMTFAVFDQGQPIPNDKPKAWIEIKSLDATGSTGRIKEAVRRGVNLQTSSDLADPIRRGDYVYSAVWSPNSPIRFALIGKIDMDRDGKDDRDDLKRMITASGGIVEYDLPPPGAGKEFGKLSSLCAYYVVDERPALARAGLKSGQVMSEDETQFAKRKGEVMKEARQLGVRPMLIDRLLTYLGYTPFSVTYGRVEHIDKNSSDALLNPRNRAAAPAAAGATAPAGDTPPAMPR